MKKIVLVKGLSYSRKGITAWKGKPVEVKDDLAAELLETGRFEENAVAKPKKATARKSDKPEMG